MSGYLSVKLAIARKSIISSIVDEMHCCAALKSLSAYLSCWATGLSPLEQSSSFEKRLLMKIKLPLQVGA
jgi:hypothetical protein